MPCKAVILAAGSGSRLAPLTPSIPKELLPVGGLPAIHHVVYEMAEMGIRDVLIVLAKGKEAIRDYFARQPVPKGAMAERLEGRRRALLSRVRVSFVYQRERLGTGDAVLTAKDFAEGEDLVVAYPDDLILFDGDREAVAPRDILSETGASMVLTRVVPRCEAEHYGIIFSEQEGDALRVRCIEEKPKEYPFEEALALVGRMRLTPECVAEISRHPLTDGAGITYALNEMAARGKLYAAVARSAVYDVGTHEGYLRTVAAICGSEKNEV